MDAYSGDTKAQRHEGTKKAGIKGSFDAGFLCAFVPLCLCVPRIRYRNSETEYYSAQLFRFSIRFRALVRCAIARPDFPPSRGTGGRPDPGVRREYAGAVQAASVRAEFLLSCC